MAVLKYFRKVKELTATGAVTYTPKRGEKNEAFAYTGQTGWRKFKVAIIRQVSPDSELTAFVDPARPKGSRFVVRDKKTGRSYYNIPAKAFLTDIDPDDDVIDTDHFRQVIEDHAADAEFFLINSGDTYMWGSGGGRDQVAEKLGALFRNYSAQQFDPYDKNSSFYGNWFKGVTGFTSRYDILDQVGEHIRAKREYRAKWKMHPTRTYRELKNGMLGVFENGRLVETIAQTWRIDKRAK